MSKNIYLIVGESGSGKTTLAEICEKELGLKQIQSYTTRPPRYEGETGHTFITDEEFSRLEDMVAYTEYCGHKYCATSEQVNNSDIYVIDPDGIDTFIDNYKGAKEIIVIYITAPIHIRVDRMQGRGDSFANVMERIVNDVETFYDYRHEDYLYNYRIDITDDTTFADLKRHMENILSQENDNVRE